MAHFMSVRPVTGLNTVNKLLSLFRLPEVPVDAPAIKHITKFLVARELKMLFRKLRKEDVLIDFEGLDDFTEDDIINFCFKRGINVSQTIKEQKEDLRLWLSISNQSNVPHSLLLIARVSDFQSGMFKIDEDETQEEILRRVRTNAHSSNHLFLRLGQSCLLLHRERASLRRGLRH